MRITIQVLPLLLLALTLPISLLHPFSFIEVLLITVGLVGLRTVLVFLKLGQRGKDKRIILESLTVSHYVEKIRWCLDYLNIPYEEEENSGILGLFILGRTVPALKIPGNAISIGNSTEILRYLYGEHCCDKEKADFLRPSLETIALEKEVWGLFQPGVPEWQKAILKLCSPLFRKLVTLKLTITEENAMKKWKEARTTIEEIDELLSDGRTTLMGTPKPTYIDFHFSSMVAIILRPNEYGGGLMNKKTFDPDQKDMPQKMVEEKEYLMKTRAGKFALNMFANHRHDKILK